MSKFVISGAPHIHSNDSVSKMMWNVVIALSPVFLVSIYFFGLPALITVCVSVASCLFFEWAITKYLLKKEISVRDGSAVITGLLLAFNLPSNIPIWITIIGALVAIGVAKMAFGGLGNNPFNPALVGRAFLMISFPVAMTTWPVIQPIFGKTGLLDAVTGPTPFGFIKEQLAMGVPMSDITIPNWADMLIGARGGALGEVSVIAVLIGGIYLLCRKVISWHIPVAFIMTVFVFAAILWFINPNEFINPWVHLLSGGLMIGAVFMATDLVTSPMTGVGKLIFGFGCGVLTILIRVWGSYPEGVSFAILIMNAFVPLINKGCKARVFGH
jgi:electron transport complex protein RnfD